MYGVCNWIHQFNQFISKIFFTSESISYMGDNTDEGKTLCFLSTLRPLYIFQKEKKNTFDIPITYNTNRLEHNFLNKMLLSLGCRHLAQSFPALG